jgi:hypothetical protein
MTVVGEESEVMPESGGGNPHVVGRNREALALQIDGDRCVMLGGSLIDENALDSSRGVEFLKLLTIPGFLRSAGEAAKDLTQGDAVEADERSV